VFEPTSMQAHRMGRTLPSWATVSSAAIEVRELRKAYGTHEAVRGITFSVARGEVFGLLGPNGAGKTTTVEILEGYRERSSGEVQVLGEDPGAGRARCASGSASSCRLGDVPLPHRPRGPDALGEPLPARARRRGDHRAGGLQEKAGRGCGRSRAARRGGWTSRSRSSATPS
jgi:energy-coupling factor transporter ATP-binding protein EcfA2